MALTTDNTRAQNPPAMTLADVMTAIGQDTNLPRARRRNFRSSMRALCKVFGEEPADVGADPADLRKRIDATNWPATGLSKKYQSTLKGHVLGALKYAGLPVMPSRTSAALSAEWAALKTKIVEKPIWCRLSRFSRFCDGRGVQPNDVNQEVFAQFEAALAAGSIKGDPAEVVRDAKWAWSKAALFAGVAAPSFPPAAKKERRYALGWEAFPESFVVDANDFLTSRSTSNPFAKDYCRPVAASTTEARRKQILQLASALAASGFPISSIINLATLTEEANAEAALEYLFKRAGSKTTPYLGQQAQLLKTIARFWVRAPAATVQRLAEMTSNLSIKRGGMVAKNREKLRQFDDEENVDVVFLMPRRVLAELARKPELSINDVARGVYAMAVDIVLRAPIRVTNLCHLKIGSELQTFRRGSAETTHIVLPKTKNGDPYEVVVPADVVRRLQRFMQVIRPKITSVESHWLFPNQHGQERHPTAFSRGIEAFIERETGFEMNAHFFRHFAMLVQSRMNPGDRETRRQLLGHRSSATTERAYTLLDTKGAAQRHEALIARLLNKHGLDPNDTSTEEK